MAVLRAENTPTLYKQLPTRFTPVKGNPTVENYLLKL